MPLAGHDIRRLTETCGRPLWEFACRWEDEDSAIPEEFAPRLRFPDAPGRRFVIGLKHVPSEVFPGSDRCEFLIETATGVTAGPIGEGVPGCVARCAIHTGRPGVCRLFPLKLGMGSNHEQRELPRHGRESSEPAYRLCPRDWTTDELQAAHTADLHDEVRGELLVWREVADLWNESSLPAEHLEEFVDAIYSGLSRG